MSHAFVYHRFNLTNSRKVWEDTSNPIIASIATLRAHNPTVPVYILDTEPVLEEWGAFPKLLNFHVVQQPCQIPILYQGGSPIQQRMTSRMWDIWTFSQMLKEAKIIYCDSDVFWLKDPIPLDAEHDGFTGDLRGDGFFYFDKNSRKAETFINVWRALTLAGVVSEELRTRMRIGGYHFPMYAAEMAYCYMIRNGMTAGWQPTSQREHYYLDDLSLPIDPKAKCYHCLGRDFGSDRLRLARRVIDWHEAIRSVLPTIQADQLLGEDKPDTAFVDLASLAR